MPAATLIVMVNLKEGVDSEEYERWAKENDAPAAKSLASVDDWRVHKAIGLLGSDAALPFDYVEVVQVNDLDQLGSDVASERMQRVTGELLTFAEPPLFVLTEQFA
jgi:hypothetical protein